MYNPAARHDGLVITESADGILVYDIQSHHIHHLNPVSAAIWQMCDSRHSLQEMATAVTGTTGEAVTAETVSMGLTLLADAGLLDRPLATLPHAERQSRRSLLKRAAAAGAIPAIVSVTAATAGASQSEPQPNCIPAFQGCSSSADVCCDHPDLGPTACRIDAYVPGPDDELIPVYRCVSTTS